MAASCRGHTEVVRVLLDHRVKNSSWSPVNFRPNEGIDQPNGQVQGHSDQLHFWEPCCGFPENLLWVS